MIIKTIRTVINNNGYIRINLPKSWMYDMGLRFGDYVMIIIDDDKKMTSIKKVD